MNLFLLSNEGAGKGRAGIKRIMSGWMSRTKRTEPQARIGTGQAIASALLWLG